MFGHKSQSSLSNKCELFAALCRKHAICQNLQWQFCHRERKDPTLFHAWKCMPEEQNDHRNCHQGDPQTDNSDVEDDCFIPAFRTLKSCMKMPCTNHPNETVSTNAIFVVVKSIGRYIHTQAHSSCQSKFIKMLGTKMKSEFPGTHKDFIQE